MKTIGTIPVLLDPPVTSTAAEIKVSGDGNFVYASIRARSNPTDTVIMDKDGRAIRRDHDADEHGNQIHVFKRNPATGKPGKPFHTVACPSPICILFAR